MRVVFRVDASPEIGGGHVMRCLTLAQCFRDNGWNCAFVGAEATYDSVAALPSSGVQFIAVEGKQASDPQSLIAAISGGCDLVVLDHYGLDQAYETACRDWAAKILVIDDLAARPHDCDFLLDQSPGGEDEDYLQYVPPGCKLLIGSKFALLRKQFSNARDKAIERRKDTSCNRLVIAAGLTDPTNVTEAALDAAKEVGNFEAVDVILGGAAPGLQAVREKISQMQGLVRLHVDVADIASLLAQADLSIGAAGVSCLERCCLGLPGIAVVTAENQRRNAQALVRSKASIVVEDDVRESLSRTLAIELRRLMSSPEERNRISKAAAELADGQGAHRVFEAIQGSRGILCQI